MMKPSKSKLKGTDVFLDFDEPIVISSELFRLLLSQKNPVLIFAVYNFYHAVAVWENYYSCSDASKVLCVSQKEVNNATKVLEKLKLLKMKNGNIDWISGAHYD